MLTSIYYLVKPLIPWRFRVLLRQLRAERRRKNYTAIWPIDESAATVPQNWPGWPGGKKFAFVLSHDVEGQKGYDRVSRLTELTQKYSFRASFNFVPKGEYQVKQDILRFLENVNFEAGVHGLEHDGKLYRSEGEFALKAAKIQQTLQAWGACGFRSPLMQHQLGWMHKLGCAYDASTFDVDPFEPQPDGMATIFPFWVPGEGHNGFVELPYTLVQDFSLFKVLGEKNIDIWKKKLDWVAEHGGMALINTHPDYMCFGGVPQRDEYPVAFYEEFLRYAREKYGEIFWHALPREVARYYRDTIPEEKRNTRRKICMVTYTDYVTDGRVRRYAETLARRGDLVDVIALQQSSDDSLTSVLNGVTIHFVFRRKKIGSSPWGYFARQVRFFIAASSLITRLHAHKRYDIVHIHNIPDYLVFAAWYPKTTGASLILDIRNLLPEMFESKSGSVFKKFYVSALRAVEKLSVRYVDHVIISNDLWHAKLSARSGLEHRCSMFANHVDQKMFGRHVRSRNDGKYIVLFAGSFQWHQGIDIAIRAFSQFRKKCPNAEFHLYGKGNKKIESGLHALVRELCLDDAVKFFGWAPLEDIARIMANADLGVVPKRADSFGNEAYSSKIMEFMSQGVPVVVSRTRIETFYYSDDEVKFFPSGDSDAMAQAMCEIAKDQSLRNSLIQHGLDYVDMHSWTRKRKQYLDLIDQLSTKYFLDTPPRKELRSVFEK